MHVDEMLAGMTHEEFAEWQAKDIIEPIGHSGTHDILARIGTLIAMFMGNKDAEEKLFKWWQQDKEKPVSDDVAIAALEMAGARRT